MLKTAYSQLVQVLRHFTTRFIPFRLHSSPSLQATDLHISFSQFRFERCGLLSPYTSVWPWQAQLRWQSLYCRQGRTRILRRPSRAPPPYTGDAPLPVNPLPTGWTLTPNDTLIPIPFNSSDGGSGNDIDNLVWPPPTSDSAGGNDLS